MPKFYNTSLEDRLQFLGMSKLERDLFKFTGTEIIRDSIYILEIGGPTRNSLLFNSNDFNNKKYYKCINLSKQKKNSPTIQMDGTNTSFDNEQFDLIFISCMPGDIRDDVLKECNRILKKNGYIIWQGYFEYDLISFEKHNFKIIHGNPQWWGQILQKESL